MATLEAQRRAFYIFLALSVVFAALRIGGVHSHRFEIVAHMLITVEITLSVVFWSRRWFLMWFALSMVELVMFLVTPR